MTLTKLFALLLAVAFVFSMTTVTQAQQPGMKGKAGAAREKAKAKMKETTVVGQVKTVSADSLVVVDKSNQEWTFAISGTTAESAQKLKAGDSVVVRYSEADGKMTANRIMQRKGAAQPCAAKQ